MKPTIICAAGLVAALLPVPAGGVEGEAVVSRTAFACTSWAGWREYVQASLRPSGARSSAACPARIPAKTRVVVIDGDAGAGAAEVRWRGGRWFIDAARLR
jgi:hypothetical protein